MTFVSVVTVAVSLFVLALAFTGYNSAKRWLAQIAEQADMVAYVSEQVGADGQALRELAGRVREFPQVDSVAVIDKDGAWRRFSDMYGTEMLTMVEQNPLPASLEISLRKSHDDIEGVKSMKREIELLAGVDSVEFSAAQAQQVKELQTRAWWGALVLAVLALVVLFYVVGNTIKLTIYARRELVINMRFVGATDSFIATPFVLEGMLQGLLGGAIAAVAVLFVRFLTGDAAAIVWAPPGHFSLLIMATGVVSACAGSVNAIRKFLD
jgi:cell division transport system permease protein